MLRWIFKCWIVSDGLKSIYNMKYYNYYFVLRGMFNKFCKKTYLLEPLWSKCCLNLFRFSNLALILCLQHHSRCQTYHKASTKKPWKCGLRKFQLCRLFVWFLWIFSAQTFLRSANILHFTFSLLVHL